MLFLNDHSPPHVHVMGPDGRAKFALGTTPDDVLLVECEGVAAAMLRRIAAAIIERHDECLKTWERHHGNQSANHQSR
jgi:hypothetical protein